MTTLIAASIQGVADRLLAGAMLGAGFVVVFLLIVALVLLADRFGWI